MAKSKSCERYIMCGDGVDGLECKHFDNFVIPYDLFFRDIQLFKQACVNCDTRHRFELPNTINFRGRQCSRCKKFKPWSEFPKSKKSIHGHGCKCKECFKFDHIMRDYGMTKNEYLSMVKSQNGVCAICKQPETSKHQRGKIKDLAVDHDHKTGKVRGLLCSRCNTTIGKFEDSIELLESAIEYLKVNK